MNRILGIALLVLGLYALVCMPHDVRYFWGGIAGVALGSMLTAFSFSGSTGDPGPKIEPRMRLRSFEAEEPPQVAKAAPPEPEPAPAPIPIHIPPRFREGAAKDMAAPRSPTKVVQRSVAPPPPRAAPIAPTPASEPSLPQWATSPTPAPAAPIPIPAGENQPRRFPTYGWFGAGRNIQMAGSLSELMAAIRGGALKPQTSVHRIDGAGKTGPVIAANSDPLLRSLFWAAENEVPDKVLPGLVKSVMQDEGQPGRSVRNTSVG